MPRDASDGQPVYAAQSARALGSRLMSVAQFAQALDEISKPHRRDENFRWFIEAAYCALAKRTALDEARAIALEARYMAVVGQYADDKRGAMSRMSELLGRLWVTVSDYDGDYLGEAYMSEELALRSRPRGQYFTPYPLARMMAKMQVSREHVDAVIAQGGPVTVMEPACGTGVFIIAFAEEIREMKLDPAQVMLATLVDVDALCIQMAFLQMWMKNIPAICIQGNSLAMTEVERACTPAALLQRWPAKSEGDQGVVDGKAPGGCTTQPETPSEAPTPAVEPLECRETFQRPSPPRPAVFEQADLFGPDE
ncbi:MAG: N-6 DNA methylase [Steroidobacteraceae bacterium]